MKPAITTGVDEHGNPTRQVGYQYRIKCRNCNKKTDIYFGSSNNTTFNDFRGWAHEHSNFPIQNQCSCDGSSMMFHDLVSYSPSIF